MADILVVDDERDVVTLIKFLLEKDGHRVAEAYDGSQALERLGVEPPAPEKPLPDLVVMDVMMPVMDGYTVSRRLDADPRARKVPLVILTAKGQMRDIFQAVPSVAAYVEKPFDPRRLREAVSAALAGKKP